MRLLGLCIIKNLSMTSSTVTKLILIYFIVQGFECKLDCISCVVSFSHSKNYDPSNACLTANATLLTAHCPTETTCCQTEVTEKNGAITGITRQCSTSCFNGCIISGFGVTNDECTRSCYENKCNHFYPNKQWFIENGQLPTSEQHVTSITFLILLPHLFKQRFF